MAFDLSNTLVIGISSTALFDMKESDQLFQETLLEDRERGLPRYRQFMLEHENEPLRQGTGYPLVKALLGLNRFMRDEDKAPLVEVVVMSRNTPETGVQVLNMIRRDKLNITRSAFTGGEPVANYMEAFDVDLFLTTNMEDARKVIDSRSCAAAVLKEPPADTDQIPDDQVRIAFDGDAVLFSEDSEIVYKKYGINAFQQIENEKENEPLEEGPYASFLKKLAALQEKLMIRERCSPIRIALVTSRNAPSEMRVIKTFRSWGVYVDEAFFLGGIGKDKVLQAFKPHIFFDDQEVHLEAAKKLVASGGVPYPSDSPLLLENKHTVLELPEGHSGTK